MAHSPTFSSITLVSSITRSRNVTTCTVAKQSHSQKSNHRRVSEEEDEDAEGEEEGSSFSSGSPAIALGFNILDELLRM